MGCFSFVTCKYGIKTYTFYGQKIVRQLRHLPAAKPGLISLPSMVHQTLVEWSLSIDLGTNPNHN